jgi:PAS domain S-box-containing protein
MDLELFDHLISDAIEGIIVTDLEGTVISSNTTSCQTLGHSAEDLAGQFIGVIFPQKSILHLLPNLMRLAGEGAGFAGEILLRSSASEEIIVRLRVDRYPQTDPEYLLFRFLDWREINDLLQELKDTSQLAILGRLTRSAAHEILNPIAAIGGFARRMSDNLPKDSEESMWAQQIAANVQVLEYLVKTVQNFINLPAPSFKMMSIGDILDESIADTEQELASRGIQLTRKRAKEYPRIFLDPGLLKKALTAILYNGIGRMPEGGILSISDYPDRKNHRMIIDDSGPSLKPHQIEDDLSPLHVMRAIETDLNLAIANRIVEDHGGEMELVSIDPAGLRVTLTLPLDRRRVSRTTIT